MIFFYKKSKIVFLFFISFIFIQIIWSSDNWCYYYLCIFESNLTYFYQRQFTRCNVGKCVIYFKFKLWILIYRSWISYQLFIFILILEHFFMFEFVIGKYIYIFSKRCYKKWKFYDSKHWILSFKTRIIHIQVNGFQHLKKQNFSCVHLITRNQYTCYNVHVLFNVS